jgi:hypothetical protein
MFTRQSLGARTGRRLSAAALCALLAFLPQSPSAARERGDEARSKSSSGARSEAEERYQKGVEAFRAKR